MLFQFVWITIFLECVWLRRWPRLRQIVAVLVVMAGTLLAAGLFEQNSLAKIDIAGVAYGLASAVTYSLFIFLTGRLQTDYDPVMKSAMMMTFGFLVIALLYGSRGWGGESEASLLGWGIVLALLGCVIPTICFNTGIPRIGSGLASLLGAMELPVAAISAWLIIGEQLSIGMTVGILLILAGIVIAEHESRRSGTRPEGLEESR
ncbi:EamA-like transporter family protein [compost metagenome]